jgi:S1-C subfamily serine protease
MRNFATLLSAVVISCVILFFSDATTKNYEKYITIIKETTGPAPPVMSQETALHLIRSSFKVISLHGAGTGFIIFAGRRDTNSDDKSYYNYIITCNHVITGDTAVSIEQFSYLNNKTVNSSTIYSGEVVITDPAHDLALVEVKTEAPFIHLVNLMTPSDLKKMKLFEPVYTCGCGLGSPPYVANAGNISLFENDMIQITSPIIFGNSGGMAATSDGKVIGVTRAIPITYRNESYPLDGYVVPARTINTWLKLNHYGFLDNANDGSSLDIVLALREKAKEVAEKKAQQEAFKHMMEELLKKDGTPPPLPHEYWDDWGNEDNKNPLNHQEHKLFR